MRGRPLPETSLPSFPHARDVDASRPSLLVRQTRLMARPAARAVILLSLSVGNLGTCLGPSDSALGRPPRRVRGVYADLSNTRSTDPRS